MLIPDLDLIRKYNQPGPRYTSYPTAPHFSHDTDKTELANQTESEDSDLSLYFHIPFCRSLCWFCGCTKIITTKQEQADHYLDLMEREIDLFIPRIKAGRKVRQLHFGGGTPNYLSPSQIDRFASFLHERFDFHPDAELGTELDPRTLTAEHIDAFRRLGINRASMGVQDTKTEVQQAVHRIQTDEHNRNALQWLREAGISSCNLDLIYGLPKQTPESFEQTLYNILEYNPDRLAVFSYAHVPWIMPAQKILEAKDLPDPEAKLRMLEKIITILTDNGYHYVGMDHFAKQDDELAVAQKNKTLQRNFQGYSTHGGVEICAFGMSSISQTSRSYRQNFKDLTDYGQALGEGQYPIDRGIILTDEDVLRRDLIMSIMCQLELNYEAKSKQHGIDIRSHFADSIESLKPMEDDGLVELNDDALLVTNQGRLFIRNIAMAFDAYLDSGKAKFSKTV
ncbi:oxygen-independent coproporphyrinogen III oxidase [Verrucomicrobiaceae bacterium N1E253]|uniref:Coproporphyrinogen-III oxidase n=1 Tax=Oceaniferula marina TaxID=2748318 RepID=A0A851GBA6_9BACT|nr:oxygen-independent coproporphyrinogen III oxidase [Oceaniferula marina]NWK54893.1 oxygen-independent coproporphyrinogen III oxidase [Oceaniferula marina]